LLENSFDRKRISANPKLCFQTDEMTSFFDKVYRYRIRDKLGQKFCYSITGSSFYTR